MFVAWPCGILAIFTVCVEKVVNYDDKLRMNNGEHHRFVLSGILFIILPLNQGLFFSFWDGKMELSGYITILFLFSISNLLVVRSSLIYFSTKLLTLLCLLLLRIFVDSEMSGLEAVLWDVYFASAEEWTSRVFCLEFEIFHFFESQDVHTMFCFLCTLSSS